MNNNMCIIKPRVKEESNEKEGKHEENEKEKVGRVDTGDEKEEAENRRKRFNLERSFSRNLSDPKLLPVRDDT